MTYSILNVSSYSGFRSSTEELIRKTLFDGKKAADSIRMQDLPIEKDEARFFFTDENYVKHFIVPMAKSVSHLFEFLYFHLLDSDEPYRVGVPQYISRYMAFHKVNADTLGLSGPISKAVFIDGKPIYDASLYVNDAKTAIMQLNGMLILISLIFNSFNKIVKTPFNRHKAKEELSESISLIKDLRRRPRAVEKMRFADFVEFVAVRYKSALKGAAPLLYVLSGISLFTREVYGGIERIKLEIQNKGEKAYYIPNTGIDRISITPQGLIFLFKGRPIKEIGLIPIDSSKFDQVWGKFVKGSSRAAVASPRLADAIMTIFHKGIFSSQKSSMRKFDREFGL